MRREILLWDGHRYIGLEVGDGITLAYAMTGLASPTLTRVLKARGAPAGTNSADALAAVKAEIERREKAATLFDRALDAARTAQAARRQVYLDPPLTNYSPAVPR